MRRANAGLGLCALVTWWAAPASAQEADRDDPAAGHGAHDANGQTEHNGAHDADAAAADDSGHDAHAPAGHDRDHVGEASAHGEPATAHALTDASPQGPALPDGLSLEQTLERAAQPPPAEFPLAVHDAPILTFFQGDQFEYRVAPSSAPDRFGWEANAWVGGDFNRLFLKPEGALGSSDGGGGSEGETETDILYSRLVRPFWSAQIGAQYANEWSPDESYSDLVSAALAVQGLAPGKFEIDLSLYVSQDFDVTSTVEVEYDYRVTQRLVLQPRLELLVAAQDVDERGLGAGPASLNAGARVRYELKRELAPYAGVRYETLVLGTADRARDDGRDVSVFYFVAGLRFALL